MPHLVTGAAGFIGYHVCHQLLARGNNVIGVDNLNDYYSVRLKLDRLAQLKALPRFQFLRIDLADRAAAERLFREHPCEIVIHLAAQAGVRYSLENPHAYVESNLTGFLNVLEGCRHAAARLKHLIYASSSSVYGANKKVPFSESDDVSHPVSLYAATKRANELMAETYSHLFGTRITGLRFFTVYGPWGRPDMAIYRFTAAISNNQPIDVYNHGQMRRDFTYIDDIVEGVLCVADSPVRESAQCPESDSSNTHRLFNIGNNRPIELHYLISTLEKSLGTKAVQRYLPMQPGDLLETCADIAALTREYGFQPRIGIEEGVDRFTQWYREYHKDL